HRILVFLYAGYFRKTVLDLSAKHGAVHKFVFILYFHPLIFPAQNGGNSDAQTENGSNQITDHRIRGSAETHENANKAYKQEQDTQAADPGG
ncbi:MAG: hypothetical protein ACI3W5_06690, partial [Faecousia sp.]